MRYLNAADGALLLPVLILSGAVLLLLLYEALSRPESREPRSSGVRGIFCLYALVGALLGLAWNLGNAPQGKTMVQGLLFADEFSTFVAFLILLGSAVTVLAGFTRLAQEGVCAHGEYYALLLMAVIGALIFASAAELIALFVGLEIMSLSLYCLCGAALGKAGPPMKRAAEAALKYFVLGSFSSAFLLYGIALLYGLTGSTLLSVIAQKAPAVNLAMLLFAVGLVLVGMAFKIGAAPFHFWAPDVYQGAPTMVTTFMAGVVKIAAAAAALRLFWGVFGASIVFWSGAVWLVAVCTMVVGNLAALRQRSLKRMLAYSSIAHAGYLLAAFLAPGREGGGGAAILYYFVAYMAMTMGAFSVVLAVAGGHADSPHPDDISRFNGLGYRRPVLGALMALFLLSLAGIPPGMAGLIGKIYLFAAALKAGYVGLVIIGVVTSAVSCYYYLRVIVAMYFLDTEAEEEGEAPVVGISLGGALGLCALAVLLLGIFPEWLHRGAAAVAAGL